MKWPGDRVPSDMVNTTFIRGMLVLCLSGQGLHAAERADPLKAFLDALATLELGFTQTLLDEAGNKIETSTGVLYLKQPGRFHWAYQSPYQQRIISDGDTLWVFDQDLEQVTIRAVGDRLAQTPAAVILGDARLYTHFVQTDLGRIEGFDWIELAPRDPGARYRNIRIGFKRNSLGMMIIADHLGQTTRIDFNDVNKNSRLDSGLFRFDVPAGVDVIDERAGRAPTTGN